MLFRFLVFVLTIFILFGCSQRKLAENAATIGYQKANILIDTGYEDKKIARDKYEITTIGHPYTPQNRLVNIALTRAGHIGLEHKFKYFKIVSSTAPIKCVHRYVNYVKSGTMIVPKVKIIAQYSNNKIDNTYRSSEETYKVFRAKLDKKPTADERISSHNLSHFGCVKSSPR